MVVQLADFIKATLYKISRNAWEKIQYNGILKQQFYFNYFIIKPLFLGAVW